ncbi:RDD family protein [Mucilaginibacter sp. HC2]|uniref:RDD family protein n=1 Tax=Mucilaginibacter inviolabilis TaxID=2714892 RepID=UPI0014081130|nr:RDD family protein [Mucilaginibacter inviolabilis]NHA05002.1 RDD family protein [Mucilaginibacter inviolabilis]
MKFTRVIPKAYIKLRILTTLIDYTIFGTFYFTYLYVFNESAQPGHMEVNGIMTWPIPIVWILYFVLLESINGTPGHDLCKLKVVKTDGSKVSFTDALKRRICDPIDIFIYGIPALILVSKTEKHQRLGDLLANTVVVKASDIVITEATF